MKGISGIPLLYFERRYSDQEQCYIFLLSRNLFSSGLCIRGVVVRGFADCCSRRVSATLLTELRTDSGSELEDPHTTAIGRLSRYYGAVQTELAAASETCQPN